MVKLYRNKYLRKYKEDFLLHIWSKENTLDLLGHSLLQKYKSKYIWAYSAKRRKLSSFRSDTSKMMRYLLIRSIKKNAYLWSNLQNISFKTNYLSRRSVIKKIHLLKFRSLFYKLLITNRHVLFLKDLNIFSNNLFWFSWLKISSVSFYKFLYLAYLLNWNHSIDFSSFNMLKNQNSFKFSFLHVNNIDPSQYIYNSSFSYKDSFESKDLIPLSFSPLKDDLQAVL